MIHGAKRKSKKYDADNSTHNRGKLTLVHCAASFSHPCLLRTLSSDKDTEAILAMGLADLRPALPKGRKYQMVKTQTEPG